MQTTPLRLKDVAKSMQGRVAKSEGVFSGRATLEGTQVFTLTLDSFVVQL